VIHFLVGPALEECFKKSAEPQPRSRSIFNGALFQIHLNITMALYSGDMVHMIERFSLLIAVLRIGIKTTGIPS